MRKLEVGLFLLSDGTLMQTYKAIPYPIPEPWRTELMKLGKIRGQDPENDIPALLRLEAKMRQVLGVDVTRKFILPVEKIKVDAPLL